MNYIILYCDDENLPSESMVRNLVNNYSFNIKYVSKVRDFIQELKTNAYSLLIIDVMAPIPVDVADLGFEKDEISEMEEDEGMNMGVILAMRVWRMDNYKNVPILFLTAKNKFQLPPNGNCSYMRKPQLAKNVAQEINDLLKNNGNE